MSCHIFRVARACRLATFAMLLLLLGSNIFGRKLLDRFSFLNHIAVYIEFGAILLLIVWAARLLASFPKLSAEHARINHKHLAAAIGCMVLFTAISEALVSLSVERVHFAKYGLLTFFLYFSDLLPPRFRTIPAAVLFSSLLGIADESLQAFVPRRLFDPRDLLLNANGALFGGALIWTTVLLRPDLRKPLSV